MHLTRLDIQRLRGLQPVSIAPGLALNWISGDNGAGKTSVLEAIHLLAYGRSFRGPVRDGLIHVGDESLEVYAEWQEAHGRQRRIGLRHSGRTWEGRLDGVAAQSLGELCAALAVITFEPGSHALVAGSSEHRRRWLDWGLFHLGPGYLHQWRRYQRALKQRNALLKARNGGSELDAWDHELTEASEPLQAQRAAYVAAILPHVQTVASRLLPRFGSPTLDLQAGWKQDVMSLADVLLLARGRDLALGHTSVGTHRADWRLNFANRPNREPYSRGQAKLVALTCLLGQARHMHSVRGEWPVVLLDDFASELDARHRGLVLDELGSGNAQVFVTGVTSPSDQEGGRISTFHVEQGVLLY